MKKTVTIEVPRQVEILLRNLQEADVTFEQLLEDFIKNACRTHDSSGSDERNLASKYISGTYGEISDDLKCIQDDFDYIRDQYKVNRQEYDNFVENYVNTNVKNFSRLSDLMVEEDD